MRLFLKFLFLICLVIGLGSCKGKKKISLSGEDPVEVSDFIEFFQPLNLPVQFSDSSLAKKEKDSLLISYKIFTQFVPDSVLRKVFAKGVKPKIYALGKAVVPKAEQYLFVKTVSADKRAYFLLAFDEKEQFIAGMPLLRPDKQSSTSQSAILDRKYTITQTMARKNRDGTISEGKDVYVLNVAARNFMLIMTEALEDKITELINPIDTLPRKHKWSADYANGKMNLVSVRDGRKNDRISFFIHFEKDNGACTGELKGEALIKSSNTAEYKEEGDPCRLKFIFSSNAVTLKEEEGCGSRRGLKCSFDGSFARKKYVKPSAGSKQKR
ncbi:MAG TPA: hypothetical protein PK092_08345 [Chitinophagaceae bacterium]|nr:hypothetical protein [Chitinophagaceae bacterium]